MIEWVTLLLLAITVIGTPLVACPLKLMDGFVLPQIGSAAIGISITLICFLQIGVLNLSLVSVLAIVYFVYMMINNSWSTSSHNTVVDVPLIFAYLVGFIIAVSLMSGNMVAIGGIALAVWWIAMFTSIYAIGQTFGIDIIFPDRIKPVESLKDKPDNEVHQGFRNKQRIDTRAISTLGNTNFACWFFITTLPFVLFVCVEINAWFWLSLPLVLWAIIATRSKCGVLAIVSALSVFFFIACMFTWQVDFLNYLFADMPVLELVIIEFGVFLVLLTFYLYARKSKIVKFLSDQDEMFNICLDLEHFHNEHVLSTLRFRFRYWKAGIALIRKRWLQGWGLRTFRKEVYKTQGELNQKDGGKFLGPAYQTPQPRECHNDWLENFVEGGIVGGLLSIVISSLVFYHGWIYMIQQESLLVAVLLAGTTASVIVGIFGFPYRLGGSALLFWLSLAMIEGIAGTTATIIYTPNMFVTIFILGSLLAMLYEGVLKPNLGNWYFTKYNFIKGVMRKERYLQKAIEIRPRDSVYRTHAVIGYLQGFPEESDRHADILRCHFDGMSPAWVVALNCSIVKSTRGMWSDSERLLQEALWYNPRFEEARQEYAKVYPHAPLPKRRTQMKIMTDGSKNLYKAIQAEIEAHKAEIATREMAIGNVILTDKVKMSIPEDWIFDIETMTFLTKQELQEHQEVVEMGPTKIPIAVRKQ